MIKFLRGFRVDSLNENRFTKYLFYAIGEIILVVIGILIALQINNWNQDRQTDKQIKTLLLALRSDLVQDTILIRNNLPEINRQLALIESLRSRVAKPTATPDTLIKVMRFEYNPNWGNAVLYNTNAYQSLSSTNLIENLSDSLKTHIKNFYNQKFYLNGMVNNITNDYRNKVADYVDRYTFGSTALHDQGELIDSLVWANIDYADLAAKFQGISNFKRIVFRLNKEDLEYSLENSKALINQIDYYLEEN